MNPNTSQLTVTLCQRAVICLRVNMLINSLLIHQCYINSQETMLLMTCVMGENSIIKIIILITCPSKQLLVIFHKQVKYKCLRINICIKMHMIIKVDCLKSEMLIFLGALKCILLKGLYRQSEVLYSCSVKRNLGLEFAEITVNTHTLPAIALHADDYNYFLLVLN